MKRSIETQLLEWKNDPNRLPLIVRGARQVGKSYTIEKFGKAEFDNIVIANFEFSRKLPVCFETLDPQEIISKIEVLLKNKITIGKTLLFLDEIQLCPAAILALRYFKEKMPGLHIIAAGSLLEFVLNDLDFSFPVGRIQFLYQKPLSFKEFLMNYNETNIIERLEVATPFNPLEPIFHEHLIELLREFLLVGGMPAPMSSYLDNKSFIKTKQLQTAILETYYNDFSKYAKKAVHQHLQELFEKIPSVVGQQFKYSSIVPDLRSRDIKLALTQLNWMALIQKVYLNTASGIPIKSQKKDNIFKLLFLDVGLLQNASGLEYEETFNQNILQINSGAIAEQFVGQELLAYGSPYEHHENYFWKRESPSSTAEIDYLIQQGRNILPIEVKAGKTGRLKSLQLFIEEKKAPFGIRVSTQPLSYENNILSIPLYMISELPRLVKIILKNRVVNV